MIIGILILIDFDWIHSQSLTVPHCLHQWYSLCCRYQYTNLYTIPYPIDPPSSFPTELTESRVYTSTQTRLTISHIAHSYHLIRSDGYREIDHLSTPDGTNRFHMTSWLAIWGYLDHYMHRIITISPHVLVGTITRRWLNIVNEIDSGEEVLRLERSFCSGRIWESVAFFF